MRRTLPFLILIIYCIISCNSTKNLSDESLEQQAISAKNSGNWLKAAQLFETLYQRNPTNETANYEAGTNYLKANYQQKGLSILKNFDTKNQDKTAQFNGRLARLAKAYYKTGQYWEVAKIVEDYHYPKMYRGLAREHLKSLIQLKDDEALAKYFYHYQKSGIYDDKGKQTNAGFLYRAICNELMLVDNTALLDFYAKKYAQWAERRISKDKRNFAIATFYQQDYEAAIEQLKKTIETEDSPRHQLELIGLLGITYAKSEKTEAANSQLEKIENFPDLPTRHDAFGAKYYHQARVELALDQKEKTVESLQKAIENKAEFWSNKFKEDGLLIDLFGHLEFEELVKEKQL